jgi:formate dehydrogenase
VQALLGDQPRRRDLLLEFLHRIQDEYRCLSIPHLAALAHELRLAMAEVYEVASFYARFDIVGDGLAFLPFPSPSWHFGNQAGEKARRQVRPQSPPLTLRVCDSPTCALMGASRLLEELRARSGDGLRVLRGPCMGRCDSAPVVEVGRSCVGHASAEAVIEAVASGQTRASLPEYEELEAYRAAGGYALLEACRAGERGADELISALAGSGLRGMGGAGFPVARKWELVRQAPKPRMLVINADEGEPGTFKDRFYLEREPHRFLEGMLVAAWAVEAERSTIYLRDEYPAVREILLREIRRLEAAGLVGRGSVQLRRGAGAYICGEESALLESLEGRRGLPRHRPPFPAEAGLFGRPTLVHNVETVYWVREIVEKGPDWFAGQGRRGSQGLRSFSVSGRVRSPGVKLAPAGISANELIEEHCGGMQEGHRFKAYLPGGASGGILPASLGDLPLDFGTLEKHGCSVGSAALIVLSDRDRLRDVVRGLLRFFEDESCGQCSPCRLGTEKAVKIMERRVWEEEPLRELSRALADASICGLGSAAGRAIQTALAHFREELVGSGS